MIVKVCGLKNEQNILELSYLNIHLFGYIFYEPSKRFVGNNFQGFTNTNQKNVMVVVQSPFYQLTQWIQQYNPQYVQLHGNEDLHYVLQLYEWLNKENINTKIIKVISVGQTLETDHWKSFAPYIEYLLFDTLSAQHGGTGTKFDWNLLTEENVFFPFILSGGIDEIDTPLIKDLSKKNKFFMGIDLNSKFEITPGIKEVKKIENFIHKLEI